MLYYTNALLLYGITLPGVAYATFHIGQFSIGRVFGESRQCRCNLYLDAIIIFLKQISSPEINYIKKQSVQCRVFKTTISECTELYIGMIFFLNYMHHCSKVWGLGFFKK